MRDKPYVNLDKFQQDGARYVVSGDYDFHAQVWVMFLPRGGAGELVPVAKMDWWFRFNVQRDETLPEKYQFISRDSGSTGFVATDDWPTWVYDTGDQSAWWKKL